MSNLYVRENWIDVDRNCGMGSSDVYETMHDNTGDLYRALVKQYGRCVSRQYIDDKSGNTKQIGWVFQKRSKYEDCNETYLLETWVSVHDAPPTKSVEYHLHSFN